MIEILEKEIYQVAVKYFPTQLATLIKALEAHMPGDLIVELPQPFEGSPKALEELHEYQQNKNRLVVWVLPQSGVAELPTEWACVPTLQEALDYIQFEQMQRDLGF